MDDGQTGGRTSLGRGVMSKELTSLKVISPMYLTSVAPDEPGHRDSIIVNYEYQHQPAGQVCHSSISVHMNYVPDTDIYVQSKIMWD